MVTNDLRLPKPRELCEPLLAALGYISDCQPGLGVYMDRLFFPTIRKFGISKKKQDEYDKAGLLYPSGKGLSLWRRFGLAFRYMRDDTITGRLQGAVYQNEKRIWMLSPSGAEITEDLLIKYAEKPEHKAWCEEFEPRHKAWCEQSGFMGG